MIDPVQSGAQRHTALRITGLLSVVLLLLSIAGCTSASSNTGRLPQAVPRSAWRFAITATTDSTLDFSAGDATWVRLGMSGYAVDPTRKDTLVATLSIVRAEGNRFSALVTGQLQPVDTAHVVIIDRPPRSFWKRRDYWSGVFTGAVIAAGAFIVAR